MPFQPDFHNMLDAVGNRKPARLPVYEHIIDPRIMGQVLGMEMTCPGDGAGTADYRRFYGNVCRFWKRMTYDTVSFEGTIVDVLPDHGAIFGGQPGPIQNQADFDRYPFEEIPDLYWKHWDAHFEAVAAELPEGMMALGGIGNGVFEISEDLVGFERLAYMQADDPQLFAALYEKIGDLMVRIWTRFLRALAKPSPSADLATTWGSRPARSYRPA